MSNNVSQWRTRTKDRMVKAMGGECQICQYKRYTGALEFHHIDPSQKDFSFGQARANNKSWPTIVAELRKCILLCSCCHREVHGGIINIPGTFSVFDESFEEYIATAQMDDCPQCNNQKPTYNKYCSKNCANQNRGKFDWDAVDLISIFEENGITKTEQILQISNSAIYKRLQKIGYVLPKNKPA